ncbi:hypothetical protein EVA_03031 [gut metagenome]|uniref:Uncharacterized protein n=1 Tax=gut metagenome TaxID=749906 RepID=J9GLR2_9ZZZZ
MLVPVPKNLIFIPNFQYFRCIGLAPIHIKQSPYRAENMINNIR